MYYYPQQQQQQYAAAAYMQPQMQLPIQTQAPALKGRPVSSLDEVRAAQIDFDGSLYVFPDIANKCIYTKQISATGAAVLNRYSLQEDMQPVQPSYVTKEELDIIINDLKNEIAEAAKVTPVEVKAPQPTPPRIF